MIEVTKIDDSFEKFPINDELKDFDQSDKIFIAVANKHKSKPSILQGTDSKWWGYKDIMKSLGINIIFLCPDYIEKKYKKKLES